MAKIVKIITNGSTINNFLIILGNMMQQHTFTVVQTLEEDVDSPGKFVPHVCAVPHGWVVEHGWAEYLANRNEDESDESDLAHGIGEHSLMWPPARAGASTMQRRADNTPPPNNKSWSRMQCKILGIGFTSFKEVMITK